MSATLGIYLLQNILYEELKIKKRNSADEISELEKMQSIPSTLLQCYRFLERLQILGGILKRVQIVKKLLI